MKTWTTKEIQFIKDYYQIMTTKELATKLNRDYTATKRVVKKYVYDFNEANLPNGYVVIKTSPIHAINELGVVIRIKTRKRIKPSLNKKGYPQICLKNQKSKTVHRIVAETFIPNPNNLPQVNHKDGNKTNNKSENLEWASASENIDHAVKTGLFDDISEKVSIAQKGEGNSSAVLTEKSVLKIYDLIIAGVGVCQIARQFKVKHSTISVIKAGKSWKHLYHVFLQRSSTSHSDVGSSESKWGASQ